MPYRTAGCWQSAAQWAAPAARTGRADTADHRHPIGLAGTCAPPHGDLRFSGGTGCIAAAEYSALLQLALQQGPLFVVPAAQLACLAPALAVVLALPAEQQLLIVPLQVAGAAALEGLLLLAVPPTVPDYIPRYAPVLEALAQRVALLLEQQRLLASSRQQTEQVAMLTDLARIATGMLNEHQMLGEATERLRRVRDYNHVEVYLLNSEGNELVLLAQAGTHHGTPPGLRQPISMGIIGRTVRHARVQRIDNVRGDTDYISGSAETHSELCVPILAGGRVLGVLNLESPQVAGFSGDDEALLVTAADILGGHD
ncbi:MAG: GAF domain-containing protein [Chloroflexaceae bacterium]|nr:GAF domain-containing protein [Chloroflexaceae bacterium]